MRLRIILIVGALALFVAGCGGGGDSTSGGGAPAEGTTAEGASSGGGSATTAKRNSGPDTKPLTKNELNVRVNEICIQVPPTYEETLRELEKGGKKLSKAERNLKAAIPPLETAIESMKATIPPPNEADELDELRAALESAVSGLEEDPTSELSGPNSPFAEFQKLSGEFGYETCEGL